MIQSSLCSVDGWRRIRAAVGRLVEADRRRGLASKLLPIDHASAMRAVGGRAAPDPLDHRGAKDAIDAAFRALPVSTEQVLHPEKYAAREPVVQVPTPTIAPLGEGFEEALVDQNGELALRLMFEEWLPRRAAIEAAAGWGGDRGVVARRRGDDGSVELAFALHTRMDTEPDAVEAVKALELGLGKVCKERSDLGPIRMRSSGRSVVIVAGPYKRVGASYGSAGDCALAERWARAILAQAAR